LPLSIPYSLATRLRRRIVSARAAAVSRPVLSVGNLSCGGTGKTPTVELLCRELSRRGLRPAIVSRGYRAHSPEGNDEALLLAENLPDVPHVQDPDRVAAARRAIDAGAEAIVLDDGFQHVRLARDLDLVLLDALRPPSRDRPLPAGLLREPLSALRVADLIAWTRTESVAKETLDREAEAVRRWAPDVPQVRLRTRLLGLRALGSEESLPLDGLAGRSVLAFAGVGNPESFRLELEALGATVTAFKRFPDHHPYTLRDVEGLAQRARAERVDAVVLTQKDAVKLRLPELRDGARASGVPWLVLMIAQEVAEGADLWASAIDRAIAAKAPKRSGDSDFSNPSSALSPPSSPEAPS